MPTEDLFRWLSDLNAHAAGWWWWFETATGDVHCSVNCLAEAQLWWWPSVLFEMLPHALAVADAMADELARAGSGRICNQAHPQRGIREDVDGWLPGVRLGPRDLTASLGLRILDGELARPALREIAENLEAGAQPTEVASKEYDVFISHASEDKDSVVRPLATQLREQGLEVWYDEFELRIGDSLRRKIDAGIARSRFGIVVLSKPFFAKGWPAYELDGLVTMSMSGRQVLLPLWHEISKDEVITASPSLADKVALGTADYTIEEIASEIASVVRNRDSES